MDVCTVAIYFLKCSCAQHAQILNMGDWLPLKLYDTKRNKIKLGIATQCEKDNCLYAKIEQCQIAFNFLRCSFHLVAKPWTVYLEFHHYCSYAKQINPF